PATSRAQSIDPYDQSRVPLEVDTTDPKLAKIVILAGGVSNKAGQHEYFAGGALFLKLLKQTPGVFPVMARDAWPKNESIFRGAKAVVIYMDGGGKHPTIDPKRLDIIRKLVADGAGLVQLHQAVDYPDGMADEIQTWLGGVWKRDIGCRGHWDMEFTHIPEHPVTRGVKPFAAPGDGWLYNLHYQPGIVPLLAGKVPDNSRTTPDAKAHAGRDEIIAWAYERPNGGRSFAFTGCDLHSSWGIESQRKLVINAILWTAKVNIPAGGAKVEIAPDDLKRNLDDKRAATPATKAASPGKAPAAGAKFIDAKSLPGIVLDDTQGKAIGEWAGSRSLGTIIGASYVHDSNKNKGKAAIEFQPEIPEAGTYEIFLHAPAGSNRASNTPVTVSVVDLPATLRKINQKNADTNGRYSLGTWPLPKGKGTRVIVSNEDTDGHVVVDAVQFVKK
ncbi:MAG: ThuA domain-containing protein, partial [Verrucomicrobiota bacterium]